MPLYKSAIDLALIETLDVVAAEAVPAETTWLLDGWIARVSPGVPLKRANSVHPLRYDGDAFDEDLAACESHYEGHGLPTRFQISPASRPEALETLLLDRGYWSHSRTAVQTCDLAQPVPSSAPGPISVEVSASATEAWWSTSIAAGAIEGRHRPGTAALLERTPGASVFVHATLEGADAGVGRGVLGDGWFGIFDVATVTELRNRGVGGSVVDALTGWARRGGARGAYLQVETRNEPAIGLYRRAGFRHLYEYEYLESSS